MNIFSKKAYAFLFSSTIFFGAYGVEDLKISEVLDFSEFGGLELLEGSDEAKTFLDNVSKCNNEEEVLKALALMIVPDAIDKYKVEALKLTIPLGINYIKPKYEKFPILFRKINAQLIDAVLKVINEKIAKSKNLEEKKRLEEVINTFKPVIQVIKDNSNAGLIKQFSLLDFSGKLIVSFSLSLALYGAYKAFQACIQKDEPQENLV